MEERQTNYTIMEGYEIPSKGLIYDVKIDPHVELRSMTARDEMKRQSPSSTQFKTLADIIEGCMIEKPKVHVYDMSLGDYEFLLQRLRVVTYGPEYKMILNCPHCGGTHDVEADLDQLVPRPFDFETFNSLRTVVLPVSGATVTLKYQTPRILDRIDIAAKEMKRRSGDPNLDFSLIALLTEIIDTVDGKEILDPSKKEAYVSRLAAKDMRVILNRNDAINEAIGTHNTLSLTCPVCGEVIDTTFRFGPEFFGPTNI